MAATASRTRGSRSSAAWALARVDGRVVDEVERLDLFGERLAFVDGFEEPEHGRRGDAGHQLAEQGGYPDGLAPDGEMSWEVARSTDQQKELELEGLRVQNGLEGLPRRYRQRGFRLTLARETPRTGSAVRLAWRHVMTSRQHIAP